MIAVALFLAAFFALATLIALVMDDSGEYRRA